MNRFKRKKDANKRDKPHIATAGISDVIGQLGAIGNIAGVARGSVKRAIKKLMEENNEQK